MSANLRRSGFFKPILAAIIFGVAISGLVSQNAVAQTAMMGQQVALTPEMVGNFVVSHPIIQERLDTFSDDYAAPEGNSPADAMVVYMTYQSATGELDALVSQFGFASFMEWVQTMSSVVTAYTFVRDGGGMDAQFQQAIDDIQNDPNFSAEQKQALIAQMNAALQSVSAMRPDQANLDAVAPYTEELAILLGDD